MVGSNEDLDWPVNSVAHDDAGIVIVLNPLVTFLYL